MARIEDLQEQRHANKFVLDNFFKTPINYRTVNLVLFHNLKCLLLN